MPQDDKSDIPSSAKPERHKHRQQAPPDEPATGFPEPPGTDPDDRTSDQEPHSTLSNPVEEPDPTEWPDPYERRPDPRDPPDPDGEPFGEEPHSPTGARSTSEPDAQQDIEAEPVEPPERDNLDD